LGITASGFGRQGLLRRRRTRQHEAAPMPRNRRAIDMDLSKLNLLAIVVAAAATFLLGGLWYSPIVFARRWMRAAGLSEAQTRQANMARVFSLSALASLVMAFNLAAFIGPTASIGFGAFAGFAAGLGWVAMSLAVIYLFEQRSLELWLINSGYQVLALTLMGAILGAWK
jgi:Protein of unknown function (DUF1761)